jgi:hypothetical protein
LDFKFTQNIGWIAGIGLVNPNAFLSNSRSTQEYVQNSSGVYVPVGANVNAISDLGLASWQASTNLFTYSQSVNNWTTKTDETISDNNIIAPDGTVTGALVTEGSAGTAILGTNSPTTTASVNLTASIFVKKSGTQWIRIIFADSSLTNGFNQWIDLTNGVLGSHTTRGAGTWTSASMTAFANGWYRVVLTGIMSTSTTAELAIISAAADGSTTRVNGATYYVWGCQLENNQSFATPPIPTTNAAVTRNADVPQFTGPALATAIAAKSSLVQTYAIAGTSGANRFVDFGGLQFFDMTGSTSARISNGTNTATATLGSGSYSGITKVSAGFDSASLTIKANGGTAATSANAWGVPATPVYLGNSSAGDRALNGFIQEIAFSPIKGAFDGMTA